MFKFTVLYFAPERRFFLDMSPSVIIHLECNIDVIFCQRLFQGVPEPLRPILAPFNFQVLDSTEYLVLEVELKTTSTIFYPGPYSRI
jgi:hypothetical protein